MKTKIKLIVVLLGVALIYTSCEDEDANTLDPVNKNATVQFALHADSLNENGDEKVIDLVLNVPSPNDGLVKVSIDSLSAKNITTLPASAAGIITLHVKKGDSKAEIRVKALNNNVIDGYRKSTFTLHPSSEFVSGTKRQHVLTIRDDDSPSQVKDSYVNFIAASPTIDESNLDWQELQIHVSEYGSAEGSLLIEAKTQNAVYGTHYITEPALENNLLTLNASKGSPVLKFMIKPLNDNVIFGNYSVAFTIKETSGTLRKGVTLKDSVSIKDDELAGLPKGYEVGGGNWALNTNIQYNPNGKIASVLTNSYTPHHQLSLKTYYYNQFGDLARINTDIGQDLLYVYENGRIVAEQKVDDGVIDRYTEYDYDEHGNVSGYQTLHLQPDGSFTISSITVLLYYFDGNLYKKLVYTPSENPDEPYLISTETYENYLDVENFFGIEFVPNVRAQKKLPGSYRIESNGKDLRYNFSYEYRNDGKVVKRIVTAPGLNSETAVYHYY